MSLIKENWSLPDPPDGFTTPVAFYFSDNSIDLDWTREPERDFAREHDIPINIEWPFIDGVKHIKDGKPYKELWQSVGIQPLW